MNIMKFPFKIPLPASLTWPLSTISQSRMEGRGGREDDMNDVVGAGGVSWSTSEELWCGLARAFTQAATFASPIEGRRKGVGVTCLGREKAYPGASIPLSLFVRRDTERGINLCASRVMRDDGGPWKMSALCQPSLIICDFYGWLT